MKAKLIDFLKWLLLKLEGEQKNPLDQTVVDLSQCVEVLQAKVAAQSIEIARSQQRWGDQSSEYQRLRAEFDEIVKERDDFANKLIEQEEQIESFDARIASHQQRMQSQGDEYYRLNADYIKAQADYESKIADLEKKLAKPAEPQWWKRLLPQPAPTPEALHKAKIARLSSITANGRRF